MRQPSLKHFTSAAIAAYFLIFSAICFFASKIYPSDKNDKGKQKFSLKSKKKISGRIWRNINGSIYRYENGQFIIDGHEAKQTTAVNDKMHDFEAFLGISPNGKYLLMPIGFSDTIKIANEFGKESPAAVFGVFDTENGLKKIFETIQNYNYCSTFLFNNGNLLHSTNCINGCIDGCSNFEIISKNSTVKKITLKKDTVNYCSIRNNYLGMALSKSGKFNLYDEKLNLILSKNIQGICDNFQVSAKSERIVIHCSGIYYILDQIGNTIAQSAAAGPFCVSSDGEYFVNSDTEGNVIIRNSKFNIILKKSYKDYILKYLGSRFLRGIEPDFSPDNKHVNVFISGEFLEIIDLAGNPVFTSSINTKIRSFSMNKAEKHLTLITREYERLDYEIEEY